LLTSGYFAGSQHTSAVNTDRWYFRVFQSAPDLIRQLLPGSEVAAAGFGLDPAEPGDRLYRFEAVELKELSHRLDGVLWPRERTGWAETGSPEFPVVLLEVQMHPDQGFHHRLAAQSYRFLQLHPQVEHWVVVVIQPHNRLNLGSSEALRGFLERQVVRLSLEELSRRPQLDPLVNLLTLPIRPEKELGESSRQILSSRPDLDAVVLPMLMQRFPQLSREEIMVIAGIPLEELRHTRAAQEWLAEGRQEGLQEGEAKGRQEGEAKGRLEGEAAVTLRLLTRRCGPLGEATTARIQALPLEQLEALADALLDFQGPADLASWLAANA
jgi:predicted transposase YdaD